MSDKTKQKPDLSKIGLMVTKDSGLIIAKCHCGGIFEQVEYRQYETDAKCNNCGTKITIIEITIKE